MKVYLYSPCTTIHTLLRTFIFIHPVYSTYFLGNVYLYSLCTTVHTLFRTFIYIHPVYNTYSLEKNYLYSPCIQYVLSWQWLFIFTLYAIRTFVRTFIYIHPVNNTYFIENDFYIHPVYNTYFLENVYLYSPCIQYVLSWERLFTFTLYTIHTILWTFIYIHPVNYKFSVEDILISVRPVYSWGLINNVKTE